MSGFDAIPKDIRDKLTAKKYDSLERLLPIDILMEKCELKDYEVNEILNGIKSATQQSK